MFGFDVPFDGRAQLWATDDLWVPWDVVENNGWDSVFTYGGRTMTTWNQRLVVGTASNMIVPDIFSMPYDMTPEEIIALLSAHGHDDLAAWLSLLDLESGLPYIGAEVFVSNAIPVPSSILLGILGVGLVCRRGRGRKNCLGPSKK